MKSFSMITSIALLGAAFLGVAREFALVVRVVYGDSSCSWVCVC